MPNVPKTVQAAGNAPLATGPPFPERPIAFEAIAPDCSGDIAPEGFAIEEDVEGSAGERWESASHGRAFVPREIALHSTALAWHHGTALTAMAPPSGDPHFVRDVAPVVAGTAMISGLGDAPVASGAGVSGSSRAASSRPCAADCENSSAAFPSPLSGQPGSGMRGDSILSAPALAWQGCGRGDTGEPRSEWKTAGHANRMTRCGVPTPEDAEMFERRRNPVRLPAVADAGRIAAIDRLVTTRPAITARSFGACGPAALPFAFPAGNAIKGVQR